MLDRNKPPQIHTVEEVILPKITHLQNSHGVNIYYHHTPGTGTFKLELFSKGSLWNAKNSAECHQALKMLKEGTSLKSAQQLSESIDSIGSFLEINPGFDNSSISLFGLSRYFAQNVSLLQEIIYQPAFHESSLAKLKKKEIDKLKQNLEKGSYIASTNLRGTLFGPEHPYGHKLRQEDISLTTLSTIESFHKNFTLSFDIYVSGDIAIDIVPIFNQFTNITINNSEHLGNFSDAEHQETRSEKFVQSSIKLGKRLFTRNHPDYFPFIVTNELLGGYFGSRLMKNIREDKGLTYGIHSHLYALNNQGYFIISSDVKGENEDLVLTEINKELHQLTQELVTKNELDTVKNYMIGAFINALSNPFSIIEKQKVIKSQQLSPNFYDHYISNVKSVTSNKIQEMACTYLQIGTLTKSIAGSSHKIA